jgi:hypothetical protein
MRVSEADRSFAVDMFQAKSNTPQVQEALHKRGLTKSQASSCARTARRRLGIYQGRPKPKRGPAPEQRPFVMGKGG